MPPAHASFAEFFGEPRADDLTDDLVGMVDVGRMGFDDDKCWLFHKTASGKLYERRNPDMTAALFLPWQCAKIRLITTCVIAFAVFSPGGEERTKIRNVNVFLKAGSSVDKYTALKQYFGDDQLRPQLPSDLFGVAFRVPVRGTLQTRTRPPDWTETSFPSARRVASGWLE